MQTFFCFYINQKGWGYFRASGVTIHIFSSNKQVLRCRSEHDALRWCAPYVPIWTKLRLLVLLTHVHFCLHIHKMLLIFQADRWYVHIDWVDSRRGKKNTTQKQKALYEILFDHCHIGAFGATNLLNRLS